MGITNKKRYCSASSFHQSDEKRGGGLRVGYCGVGGVGDLVYFFILISLISQKVKSEDFLKRSADQTSDIYFKIIAVLDKL